jgi:hypothetical protein
MQLRRVENDVGSGNIIAAVAGETRLTRLVFAKSLLLRDPRLQALGCHTMAALQHLDVTAMLGLSAGDCRYLGRLHRLTMLKLPLSDRVGG